MGSYERKLAQLTSDISPALMPGEALLAVAGGIAHVQRFREAVTRRGTLFVTDRRVGIFTKQLGGHDVTDFSYGLLTSVECKKGLVAGEITLLAAGGGRASSG